MLITWQEQNATDVPADDGWLAPPELTRLAAMRFAQRRADWRLGRWTAKLGVAACLGLPATRETFRELEIRPAPSGAPQMFLANQLAAVAISLSHRSGMAVCAAARGALSLGCDLERIEPHSDIFLADYFTDEEQALVRAAPPAARWSMVALLWSAKESLLKALELGLRADTRSVNVSLALTPVIDPAGWHSLRAYHPDCGCVRGWWYEHAGFVRTLVAAPAASYPH
jgi:4'-phosphopantetheinyl transferase